MRRVLPGAGAAVALAVILFVAFGGVALINYDTLYTIIWGRDLARGVAPDLEVVLAPTPHPLQEIVSMPLVLLFGDAPQFGASAAWVVSLGAYLLLGVLGVLVFALGRAWFGWAVGAVAAVIVLTREPMLSYGLRAYVDLPYLCLLLGALVVLTRRPRAGWPVLVLLGAAGLLRPEAWLFSGAYVLWLGWGAQGLRGRGLAGAVALAAAAPLLWALHDALITGNPLWSLSGTRDNAATLGRETGLTNIPTTVPRRLGEILREPVLLAAVGGLGFGWLHLRDRIRLPIVAGALGLGAFCVLATAGLSILVRYLLPVSVIGAVLAGVGLFGWRLLDRDDPTRRWWIGFAAVSGAVFLVFTPGQIERLDRLQRALATQEAIVDDLQTFFDGSARDRATCAPAVVPNRRPVPYVALWTGSQPGDVLVVEGTPTSRIADAGTVFAPRTAAIGRQFVFDPRDARAITPTTTPQPRGAKAIATRSWTATAAC